MMPHPIEVKKYKIIGLLFGWNGQIQNPPNSPDLAYWIEDLWSIIKPRVKRREPSSLKELKKYLIEEWSSIPLDLVQNLCKNYLYRINIVLELGGDRLEPEHLKKEKHDFYIWEKRENIQKICMVYNDKILGIQRKNEIRKYKSMIKSIKKEYTKKKKLIQKYKKDDLKIMSIEREALSIINAPTNIDEEKNKKIERVEKKLMKFKNEFNGNFKYLNEIENDKENKIVDEKSLSTIDEELQEKLSK